LQVKFVEPALGIGPRSAACAESCREYTVKWAPAILHHLVKRLGPTG
jgi:hypothetical protein